MNDKSANDPSTTVMRSIGELLEAGTTAVLVTLMDATLIDGSALVGAKLLLDENGKSTGTLGSKELDAFATAHASTFVQSRDEVRAFRGKDLSSETDFAENVFLFERIHPELRVVICGAGHVGGWLATFASQIGYRVTLIDDREEFLKREKFPNEQIQLLVAHNWTDAVREAVGNGKGVSIAVVTRGHNEDEQCMRAAIATNPDYIGLIGSKRRTSIVINRLREAGATEQQVKNIHAPIGLDIGAVTPEEVALAILAEIICQRRGGTGGFMSAARRASTRQR